jgi:lipid II:glycine glycyltransferase (peptidoglycan interpeptide bridge formation enzyme)
MAEADSWSWLGYELGHRGIKYLYVPYGPTVSDGDGLANAAESLSCVAAASKLDFVRFEPVGLGPLDVDASATLVPVSPVQPARTRVVDLRLSEEELRRGLDSDHRNTINRVPRTGIELSTSTDPADANAVIDLLEHAAVARRFRSHEREYFETMLRVLMPRGFAKLGLAHYEGALASAGIVFDSGPTRAYAHAGNSAAARKLRTSAPLVWHLIMEAKANGAERFDLWGVSSPQAPRTDAWSGFTEFKRAFGGLDVEYAGAFEIPVARWRYRAFHVAKQTARRVRDLKR